MVKRLIIKKTNILNKQNKNEFDILKKWTLKTILTYTLISISILLSLCIYFITNKIDTSSLTPIVHNLFKVLNIILDASLK